MEQDTEQPAQLIKAIELELKAEEVFDTATQHDFDGVCLDLGFLEDECRVRQGYASEYFAVLRHIAMNLLKQEDSFKGGIKAKRLRAGWDNDYLLKLLCT